MKARAYLYYLYVSFKRNNPTTDPMFVRILFDLEINGDHFNGFIAEVKKGVGYPPFGLITISPPKRLRWPQHRRFSVFF
jgi:hypothetical protein